MELLGLGCQIYWSVATAQMKIMILFIVSAFEVCRVTVRGAIGMNRNQVEFLGGIVFVLKVKACTTTTMHGV